MNKATNSSNRPNRKDHHHLCISTHIILHTTTKGITIPHHHPRTLFDTLCTTMAVAVTMAIAEVEEVVGAADGVAMERAVVDADEEVIHHRSSNNHLLRNSSNRQLRSKRMVKHHLPRNKKGNEHNIVALGYTHTQEGWKWKRPRTARDEGCAELEAE